MNMHGPKTDSWHKKMFVYEDANGLPSEIKGNFNIAGFVFCVAVSGW